jgi:hypothetical protein
MLNDDLAHPQVRKNFFRSLTETVVWCLRAGNVADPKTSLRTFEPKYDHLSSQHHQVFCVSLDRSNHLRSIGQDDLVPVTDLRGGRLLAYFPDDTLSDGVAADESNGFFDDVNIPPYDTWVWMVQDVRTVALEDGAKREMPANFLVAWVPPAFIELANKGILVNPEECIAWLDELDNSFTQTLRRLNLIK